MKQLMLPFDPMYPPYESAWGDPVFFDGAFWYFWQENWCDHLGPFLTEEEARTERARYVHWLNTGEKCE